MRDKLVTRPLDPERDRWFFCERWPLTAEVRAGLRPLDEGSSRLVWNALIRRNQFVHPNQLPRGHWSRETYRYGPNWEEVFNQLLAGTAAEPDPVTAFLRAAVPWPDELPVLFIEHRDDAILATWGSFVSAWPHFISLSDEGPLVVSWERPEFLGFWPDGGFGIGLRGPADSSRRAMQQARPRRADDLPHRAATVHHYYAARSDAKLEAVCEAMGAAFGLPPFVFDGHDNWRYAWSEDRGLRLNVTRATDDCTVETWMSGCPPGVNYQVILDAVAEPTEFASRLAAVLGSEVIRYTTIDRRADVQRTDAPEDPLPTDR